MLVLIVMSMQGGDSFYALKGGLLSHGEGPISSGREDGIDLHAEVLFDEKFLNAYPTVGTDINVKGNTSFIYGGLAWEGRFFKHLLLGGFLGIAVHDGDLDRDDVTKRQFGTRFLFREAVEVGFYLSDHVAVGLIYDHCSNAGLAGKRNQGNDNTGVRISYYF